MQALGLSFLVSTVTLAVGRASGGAFGTSVAWVLVLTLVPALEGIAPLGQFIRCRISTVAFRRCFCWGLLMLGVHLAVRNW